MVERPTRRHLVPPNRGDLGFDSLHSHMEDITKLPESRGRDTIKRVLSIYRDLWRHERGFEFKILNWGMLGSLVKKLSGVYTEVQIAALLIVFFNWHGLTGNDKYEHEAVAKASYAFGWFFKCCNQYETYLRNTYGLEFDDPVAVRKFVAEHMTKLSTHS